MNDAASPSEAQGARPVLNSQKPGTGRTRPTNNQLLYKAYLRWEHYSHQLHGDPKLPAETEACASVTSAFLQVMSILFEVESLRVREPRNILQILSTNTRRTKVVELMSGTHRVPDELKKHSLSDGVGGQYSTNLDRNRYGADDQYLSTVIRYDLEYLRLCPCLVDVEIIDAKNGSGTILVSAGPEYCLCQRDAAQGTAAAPGRPLHGGSVVPAWNSAEAKPAAPHPMPAGVATLPTVRPGVVDPGLVCNTSGAPAAQQPAMPGSAGKSDGSNLFDALLLAASGGRDKKQQPGQPGAAQPGAEAAAGEEAQVSSKPVEWPMVPPGSKRQRSRLHQTPGSAPPGAAPEDPSPHAEAEANAKTPRASSKRPAQVTVVEGQHLPMPQASREHSGENRVAEQTPLAEAGDLGSLSAVEAGAGRSGAFHVVGSAAQLAPEPADAELRRLQQEVRTLRAGSKRAEAALEESRARELGATANAEALRAQLDAFMPAAGAPALESAPSGGTSLEKKVLGQATWEESKERHAQRSSVQMPRMVYTLRVEVQRLQVKVQEAEARASASQRIAEEAQRELQAVAAAGTSPLASQARQAMDAEKALLRQQLMEAQAALQSVKAEKQALEECLSATASARHTPPSAQAAPVTPQPHRSGNVPSAQLSDGTEKKPLVSSPGEGGASALLTLSSQDAQHITLAGDSQHAAASQGVSGAALPVNGGSQPMLQVTGAPVPNGGLPAGMSMPLLQEGGPAATPDNYQAALAMATPEQIQQALAALAQAASASAGGQLKPEDLAALFGPQWATLVAMPGGLVALPPDQLQQLAAFEAPAAPAALSGPSSQPLADPAPPAEASHPAASDVHAVQGAAADIQQKAQEQGAAPAPVQRAFSGEFDMNQVLNLSGGSLPTSA